MHVHDPYVTRSKHEKRRSEWTRGVIRGAKASLVDFKCPSIHYPV